MARMVCLANFMIPMQTDVKLTVCPSTYPSSNVDTPKFIAEICKCPRHTVICLNHLLLICHGNK